MHRPTKCKSVLAFLLCFSVVREFVVTFMYLSKTPHRLPFFHRIQQLNCPRLIENTSIKAYRSARLATVRATDEYHMFQILSNCSDFHRRFYFPSEPNTAEEAGYPLAYSIRIYSQSERTVKLLQAIYAPQNSYCIHVDWKSPKIIHDNIHLLSKCVPNVVIATPQSVYWGGPTMMTSTVSCIEDLFIKFDSWKYVIVLEEFDVPIRTNFEIVYVLSKLYQTENDVELSQWSSARLTRRKVRYNRLGLPYGRGRRIVERQPERPFNITLYKGAHQVSLHRNFVNFMLSSDKGHAILQYMAGHVDIADEAFFSTLIHNQHLGAPGSFPSHCLGRRNYDKSLVTRYSIWYRCPSKQMRHGICLWGIRNLTTAIRLKGQFFINKFHPRYEPQAFECMREYMFNRTYVYPKTDPSWYRKAKIDLFGQHYWDSPVQYRLWKKTHSKSYSSEYNCIS